MSGSTAYGILRSSGTGGTYLVGRKLAESNRILPSDDGDVLVNSPQRHHLGSSLGHMACYHGHAAATLPVVRAQTETAVASLPLKNATRERFSSNERTL